MGLEVFAAIKSDKIFSSDREPIWTLLYAGIGVK
jgi:hypothetical protein